MALAGLPSQQYQQPHQTTLMFQSSSQFLSTHHQQHLPLLNQQQDLRHAPNQQHDPRSLPPPVPLMSIKVPFPVHLRSHPRVRPKHPRISLPVNRRHRNFAHTDPNPILNNIRNLNY